MSRAMIVALALLPCAGVAAQQPAAFPSAPPLAAPKRFVAPAIHERRLPNGLLTALVPFGSARVTYIQLTVGAGRLEDPLDRQGVASIAGAILREGTRSFDRRAIALTSSTLGLLDGDVQITVGSAETVIAGRVLADSAEGLLRLIASLAREPTFPAESFQRLAREEARQAHTRATQASERALAVADSVLFVDPALRGATDSSVARVTIDDVRRFWSRYYRPRNATLYVAGSFDRERMTRAIDRVLGDWSGDSTAARAPASSPTPRADGGPLVIHLIDRPGASQARVVVAFRAPDPGASDYLALNQLNVVMGSVQTSRIIRNVRESHGYSYNISSTLSARPGSTRWIVSGDVANASVGPALREILAEIGRVRDTTLSAAELRGFQTFIAGVLISEHSTPEGIVSTLAWQRLFGVDPRYLGSFVESTYAVEPEDLRKVAQRYLDPRRAAIVVAGDRTAIERQLADVASVVLEGRQ